MVADCFCCDGDWFFDDCFSGEEAFLILVLGLVADCCDDNCLFGDCLFGDCLFGDCFCDCFCDGEEVK